MRTTPPTNDEIDAWLTVLSAQGHLHRAQSGPDESWTVWRTPSSTPHTLHHPVLALDYIAELLRAVRRNGSTVQTVRHRR
ncbi:hypothetical protein [Streptomyces iranensis]|uniref:Uncharacterized protein n=1 Tax=Streptomyces iranensis TaxID=576784 RepID=A0A060ZW94_9ACTN|nr:hypothetical protein [Streptomyces iranensis]MBP2059591.1 hypothetical protein [Streptomyces iranensis]CDR10486.1 predicted protein [Streptomyces iranensis]